MAKRKKTRRYSNGGINDDKFTRQDSVNVHVYRDLTSKLGGSDPVQLLKGDFRKYRPSTNQILNVQNLENIRDTAYNMGELGDFKPNPDESMTPSHQVKAKGGMVGKSKGNRDQFTEQYD